MSVPLDNPVQAALLARHSGKAASLLAPAPDAEQLAAILKAAAHAPDHGLLVPFRFLHIVEDARESLADIIAAASLALKPDLPAVEVARAREKATQGAMLLVMVGKLNPAHPKITASDQWLAMGCALENLLLSAQALGFGVAIRSGAYLDTVPMKTGLHLAEGEHALAILAIGTPKEWPPHKPKPDLEQIFSVWAG
jgi:nitroreductase